MRVPTESRRAARYPVCLIHPFDPRGTKVGGLETYIRDFITFHPDEFDLLMIGADSQGDLTPGEIHRIAFRGRNFDFLPILHYPDDKAREAARKVRDSITAQFFAALVRRLPQIAGLIRRRRYSIDLRRVEFSWLPAMLRAPFVQMLHGEGAPNSPMDSLLRKYAFVHNIGERFAMATSENVLCVNPFITERLKATYPTHADKIDTLWTWVNTRIFQPQPFPALNKLRIVFAGRLDEFKNPPLMFRTIARLRELTHDAVEFHYVGTSSPHRFAEFAAIAEVSVLHGFLDAASLAAVIAQSHAGILTSDFEGMPRCVLETLAVGRPVIAVHLPQLEAAIHDGESGYLVPRDPRPELLADDLAQRFLTLRESIAAGQVDPFAVARHIGSFTPHVQLARVFKLHRDIQDVRRPRADGHPLVAAPEPDA